jgi:hypothetical protein
MTVDDGRRRAPGVGPALTAAAPEPDSRDRARADAPATPKRPARPKPSGALLSAGHGLPPGPQEPWWANPGWLNIIISLTIAAIS